MEAKAIDLAQDKEAESAKLSVTPGEKESDEAVESEFPHFHYESEEPLDIPAKGVMHVRYEIVFDRKEGDKYLYKIDLHEIVGVEEPGEEEEEEEGEELEPAVGALDRLAAAKTREKANVPS